MALSAFFVEDHTTHIVSITINVAAAGAVVVMVQEINTGIYDRRWRGIPDNRPDHPPQAWSLISEGDLEFRSQSYRLLPDPHEPTKNIPTYLLGVSGPTSYGIQRSIDGVNWTTTYSAAKTGLFMRQPGFIGLTWHPDDELFYGFVTTIAQQDEFSDLIQEAQIFSSPDGIAWTGGERLTHVFGSGPVPDWDATIVQNFRNLCVKPENRGGIPDGVQGYDPATGIFMKPAAALHWNLQGMQWLSSAEGLTIEGSPEPTTSPPGIGWLVSFAGKTWNAVMYDANADGDARATSIYVSRDNGKSWQLTFETAGWFPGGMVAGDAADVLGGES